MRTDLTYERMSRGELDLPEEPGDAERLAALAEQDKLFLGRHPDLPPAPPRPRRLWTCTALAAAVLVMVGVGSIAPRGTDTRMKGSGPVLAVYLKTPTGTERLEPGATLGSGAEVQFAYQAPGQRYGAIVSVDGRGTVTAHLPLEGDEAVSIDGTGAQLLPYSYRLDDAPDFELVALVTSSEPFEVSKVVPFVLALARGQTTELALPGGFEGTMFRIAKKELTP